LASGQAASLYLFADYHPAVDFAARVLIYSFLAQRRDR
jgi:hypothetical protein